MILVVACDMNICKTLEKEFPEFSEHEICFTDNQKMALEKALTGDPELIFVESQGKLFSAQSLITFLRQSSCTSPIILLTDKTTEEIIELLRLGANDFIRLPIEGGQAQQVIQRALEGSQNRIRLEKSHQKLVLDEAVRITLTTLSHYLNNYLTALDGDLILLNESLQNHDSVIRQLEIVNNSTYEVSCIKRVIEVLVNTKSIKLKDYDESVVMIDLDAQLSDGLDRAFDKENPETPVE